MEIIKIIELIVIVGWGGTMGYAFTQTIGLRIRVKYLEKSNLILQEGLLVIQKSVISLHKLIAITNKDFISNSEHPEPDIVDEETFNKIIDFLDSQDLETVKIVILRFEAKGNEKYAKIMKAYVKNKEEK